ncbi:hypothetical protein E3N88_14319 [Mikania micrantha]|uniref:Uncharacterized protein n=1 Tax=Mikania micrantha TaxID=192012 RepID=A0A5N6P159_9ASTR|nr:hypothetical protein E3N88_14319 [Mikania micrantha]
MATSAKTVWNSKASSDDGKACHTSVKVTEEATKGLYSENKDPECIQKNLGGKTRKKDIKRRIRKAQFIQ